MSKKVKIYCYKLNKPVAKELKKNLGVGDRIEYENGFIKENLGNIYLFVSDKMKKGDTIALSNNYTFQFAGTQYKKITYIQEDLNEVFSSIGTFLVMPGKTFLSIVDPENKFLEVVVLDRLVDKIFTEVTPEVEIPKEETPEILNEDPVVSQVTLEEQKPIVSTDPLDGNTLVLDPEDIQEALEESTKDEEVRVEVKENEIVGSAHFSENPEEWFEEAQKGQSIFDALDEMEAKIEELEKENFRLSKKINSTIEEIKNLSFWDTILFRWKTKLLDILNL